MIGLIGLIAIIILLSVLLKVQINKKKINKNYYKDLEKIDGIKYVDNPYDHILISNWNLCTQIYNKPMSVPINYNMGNVFERWLGSCMGCMSTNDPAWAKLKKIFMPAFTVNDLIINLVINEWVENLRLKFETKQIANIEDIINDMPFKYVAYVIFGKNFYEQNQKSFNKLCSYSNILINDVFTNSDSNVVNKFNKKWNKLLTSNCGGILKKLSNRLNKYSDVVTFSMFTQTLCEILFANQDVVKPAFAWLIVNYMKYNKDLDNISNFIEESGRLEPVAFMSMPKKLDHDVVIDGILIKKDTVVRIDFKGLAHSKEWNMNDLDTFRPNRFDKLALISRFGFAGRKCPGRNIANSLFEKALIELRDNWLLVNSNIFNPIHVTGSFFRMPKVNVCVLRNTTIIPNYLMCVDCHPQNRDNGFVVISVNEKSPYLQRQNCEKLLINLAKDNHVKILVIADEIAHFNFQAFNGYKKTKAMDSAMKLGTQIYDEFSTIVTTYDLGIKICRWQDINMQYIDQLEKIKYLDERVDKIANNFLQMRNCVSTNKSFLRKKTHVKSYIYSEIPVLCSGIIHENNHYNVLYYSGTNCHLSRLFGNSDSLYRLIYDIKTDKKFENVRNVINNCNGGLSCNGFVAVDIDLIE